MGVPAFEGHVDHGGGILDPHAKPRKAGRFRARAISQQGALAETGFRVDHFECALLIDLADVPVGWPDSIELCIVEDRGALTRTHNIGVVSVAALIAEVKHHRGFLSARGRTTIGHPRSTPPRETGKQRPALAPLGHGRLFLV